MKWLVAPLRGQQDPETDRQSNGPSGPVSSFRGGGGGGLRWVEEEEEGGPSGLSLLGRRRRRRGRRRREREGPRRHVIPREPAKGEGTHNRNQVSSASSQAAPKTGVGDDARGFAPTPPERKKERKKERDCWEGQTNGSSTSLPTGSHLFPT